MAVLLATLLYRYMNVLKPFSSPRLRAGEKQQQQARLYYQQQQQFQMTDISSLTLGQPAVTSDAEEAGVVCEWEHAASSASRLLPSPPPDKQLHLSRHLDDPFKLDKQQEEATKRQQEQPPPLEGGGGGGGLGIGVAQAAARQGAYGSF